MMWSKKRGIVAKISANNCIIISPEGTFHQIPLPSPETRVGAEVFYRNPHFSYPFKYLLMVASLLVLVMGYTLLPQTILPQVMLPQAVAYVSLDIDPSLEMSVDKHLRVIAVQCFNDDATNLVKALSLEGKGLNDALTEVINQAMEKDFIKAGQDNLMILTISPSGTAPDPVDQIALYQVLENSIASRGYSGQVKIYAVNADFHTEAQNKKLSAGKYLIYEQLLKSGNNVNVDDINSQAVRQLAEAYKLDLLPNYKKIMIQTAQTNQDPQIIVDDNGRSVAIEDYVTGHGSMSDGDEIRDSQPDANVSRSYPARKSRTTQTIPVAGTTTNPELTGENSIRTVAGCMAVENPVSSASNVNKSGI